MNIQEEYESLKRLANTKHGWKMIEESWNLATNKEKRKGEWYSKSDSFGSGVEGFAVDPETRQIKSGTFQHHLYAKEALITQISKQEKITNIDDLEFRVICGWRGRILNFDYPCVVMASIRLFGEPGLVDKIDEIILETGSGLPLNGLYFDHMR